MTAEAADFAYDYAELQATEEMRLALGQFALNYGTTPAAETAGPLLAGAFAWNQVHGRGLTEADLNQSLHEVCESAGVDTPGNYDHVVWHDLMHWMNAHCHDSKPRLPAESDPHLLVRAIADGRYFWRAA